MSAASAGRARGGALLLTGLLAAAAACRDAPSRPGEASSSRSPGAEPGIVEALRADLAAPRHPSDGGGRAWIEEGPDPIQASSAGGWAIVYEAGPLGVAEGGMIFLQVSPFWGWSTPQVTREDAPGYTRVTTAAEGVRLEAATLDRQLLGVRVTGRALEPGARVRIEYGAGAAGARVDTYAERGSRFFVAVDGDGDGVRRLLDDVPGVEVTAGPPARLVLALPSVVRPGVEAPLRVAVLDAVGNAGPTFAGTVSLAASGGGGRGPARVRLALEDRGLAEVGVQASAEEGTVRFDAEAPGGLRGTSNPLVVSKTLPLVRWGDLHGHSGLSDGTGTPEDYFRYARDVAALDVAALTDHDHWGMRPLATNPQQWEEIEAQVRAFHEPPRFVALLGYEWTSWIHGHRHVLYFGDEGRVHDSVDPAFESPQQLWDALRGEAALTIAHHTAGGPIAANWEIPPDPELEPVTEVASVHGSSEAPDSPHLIYSPVAGHFARDALDRGYRLGFVGSGDSHDGHPGLVHLAASTGGLVGILADDLTREGVLEALRARRVYATNGPRIVLHATLDGAPMGSAIEGGDRVLEVRIAACSPLERIDLVRSGKVARTFDSAGALDQRLRERVKGLGAGEYLYLRAVQRDGGAAWSSPFFLE